MLPTLTKTCYFQYLPLSFLLPSSFFKPCASIKSPWFVVHSFNAFTGGAGPCVQEPSHRRWRCLKSALFQGKNAFERSNSNTYFPHSFLACFLLCFYQFDLLCIHCCPFLKILNSIRALKHLSMTTARKTVLRVQR